MRQIGPYQILEVIRDGGMGRVFKAYDTVLKRHVALKSLLPKDAADEKLRGRLKNEAEAQARLQHHKNVVEIYAPATEGGELFLVMEFAEGKTLRKVLDERKASPMPIKEARPLFQQLLKALDHVHKHGVIHRDVTPSNIMVNDGAVKLLDFGIAHIVGSPRQTTTPIGVARYMSPEQFDVKSSVDHRTDIYSAAVVVYEMLAGRPAYNDIPSAVYTPPELKEFVPGVPHGVSDAIAVAMSFDRERRFKTIADFYYALDGACDGFVAVLPDRGAHTTVRTPPPPTAKTEESPQPSGPPLPKSQPKPKPHKWTIAVSLLIAGLSMIAIFQVLRHSPRQRVAVTALPVTTPARRQQPAPVPQTIRQTAAPVVRTTTVQDASMVGQPRPSDVPAREKALPPIIIQPLLAPVTDTAETRRRDVATNRDELTKGFALADELLGQQKFDEVQQQIDHLTDVAQRYPDDFWQERDQIRHLTKRLTDARVTAQTWQARLDPIDKAMSDGEFAVAQTLAKALADDPHAPLSIAARARELQRMAKARMSSGWSGTELGETKNEIRKPSSPPRN